MCPGLWVNSSGGRADIATACGVTTVEPADPWVRLMIINASFKSNKLNNNMILSHHKIIFEKLSRKLIKVFEATLTTMK